MSDANSTPQQTPTGGENHDQSSDSGPESKEEKERITGSGFQGSNRMTGDPNSHSVDASSGFDSTDEPTFDSREEALEVLQEVREIGDPVERLKEFHHGKGMTALLELETNWFHQLEAPTNERLEKARKRAFRDIKRGAENSPLAVGIEYLEDVIFELDIAGDVEGVEAFNDVIQKVRKLKKHLEKKKTRRFTPSSINRPVEANESPDGANESTVDRWRHLARAAKILERYSGLDNFDDFKEKALQMDDELGLEGHRSPGETIKKGVWRLRQDLTDEEGTPARYHEMEGFQELVNDLVRGEDVSITGSSPE